MHHQISRCHPNQRLEPQATARSTHLVQRRLRRSRSASVNTSRSKNVQMAPQISTITKIQTLTRTNPTATRSATSRACKNQAQIRVSQTYHFYKTTNNKINSKVHLARNTAKTPRTIIIKDINSHLPLIKITSIIVLRYFWNRKQVSFRKLTLQISMSPIGCIMLMWLVKEQSIWKTFSMEPT